MSLEVNHMGIRQKSAQAAPFDIASSTAAIPIFDEGLSMIYLRAHATKSSLSEKDIFPITICRVEAYETLT